MVKAFATVALSTSTSDTFVQSGNSEFRYGVATLYLTEIDEECNDATVYFPTFDKTLYEKEILSENKENDINNILDNNTKYSISKSGSYATVELTSKVKFITPFSNIFFKNDYNISTKRVILYE